ncbi:hypothetical protein KIPB_003056, partial [Kipferlia bialata]
MISHRIGSLLGVLAVLAVCYAHGIAGTGLNDYGQLGLGDQTNRKVLTDLGSDAFKGETPADVCAGYKFTMILTDEGHVFTMGVNDHGQLGRGLRPSKPVLINVPTTEGLPVSAVSRGNTSYILTSTGQIWAFGYNYNFQARPGISGDVKRPALLSYRPAGVPKTAVATQISSGQYFCLILLDSGDLVSLGLNTLGQMGNGSTDTERKPQKVLTKWAVERTVINISVGANHSLVLLDDGSVYCWGDNEYHQCSTSAAATYLCTPTSQDLSQLDGHKATRVTALAYGSTVTDARGGLYAKGHNGAGELGTGTTEDVSTYTAVTLSSESSEIVAISGCYNTFVVSVDTSIPPTLHTDPSGSFADTTVSMTHIVSPPYLHSMHIECSGEVALGVDKLSIGQGVCGGEASLADRIEWTSATGLVNIREDLTIDFEGSTSDCFYVEYTMSSPAYVSPRWQCTYTTVSASPYPCLPEKGTFTITDLDASFASLRFLPQMDDKYIVNAGPVSSVEIDVATNAISGGNYSPWTHLELYVANCGADGSVSEGEMIQRYETDCDPGTDAGCGVTVSDSVTLSLDPTDNNCWYMSFYTDHTEEGQPKDDIVPDPSFTVTYASTPYTAQTDVQYTVELSDIIEADGYTNGQHSRWIVAPSNLSSAVLEFCGSLGNGDTISLYSGVCSGTFGHSSFAIASDTLLNTLTGDFEYLTLVSMTHLEGTEELGTCIYLDLHSNSDYLGGSGFSCSYTATAFESSTETLSIPFGTIAPDSVGPNLLDTWVIDMPNVAGVSLQCDAALDPTDSLLVYSAHRTPDGTLTLGSLVAEDAFASVYVSLDPPSVDGGENCVVVQLATSGVSGVSRTVSCDYIAFSFNTSDVVYLTELSGTIAPAGYPKGEHLMWVIAVPTVVSLDLECRGWIGSDSLSTFSAHLDGEHLTSPTLLHSATGCVSFSDGVQFAFLPADTTPNSLYVELVAGYDSTGGAFSCTYAASLYDSEYTYLTTTAGTVSSDRLDVYSGQCDVDSISDPILIFSFPRDYGQHSRTSFVVEAQGLSTETCLALVFSTPHTPTPAERLSLRYTLDAYAHTTILEDPEGYFTYTGSPNADDVWWVAAPGMASGTVSCDYTGSPYPSLIVSVVLSHYDGDAISQLVSVGSLGSGGEIEVALDVDGAEASLNPFGVHVFANSAPYVDYENWSISCAFTSTPYVPVEWPVYLYAPSGDVVVDGVYNGEHARWIVETPHPAQAQVSCTSESCAHLSLYTAHCEGENPVQWTHEVTSLNTTLYFDAWPSEEDANCFYVELDASSNHMSTDVSWSYSVTPYSDTTIPLTDPSGTFYNEPVAQYQRVSWVINPSIDDTTAAYLECSGYANPGYSALSVYSGQCSGDQVVSQSLLAYTSYDIDLEERLMLDADAGSGTYPCLIVQFSNGQHTSDREAFSCSYTMDRYREIHLITDLEGVGPILLESYITSVPLTPGTIVNDRYLPAQWDTFVVDAGEVASVELTCSSGIDPSSESLKVYAAQCDQEHVTSSPKLMATLVPGLSEETLTLDVKTSNMTPRTCWYIDFITSGSDMMGDGFDMMGDGFDMMG